MREGWQRLLQLATGHGYASLALLALVDGAGAPLPAELVLVALNALLARAAVDLYPAAVLAAAANTAGAMLLYALGRLGGSSLSERLLPRQPERQRHLEAWLARYGSLAVALARATGIFRLSSVVLAGSLRLPAGPTALAIFAGSLFWFLGGSALLRAAGTGLAALHPGWLRRRLDLAAAVLILALGAMAVLVRWRRAPSRAATRGRTALPGRTPKPERDS